MPPKKRRNQPTGVSSEAFGELFCGIIVHFSANIHLPFSVFITVIILNFGSLLSGVGPGPSAPTGPAWPQPTGTSLSQSQHDPPRLLGFAASNASWGGGVGTSIGGPHITGNSRFSSGTPGPPPTSHLTGGAFSGTGSGGGPIPISQDLRVLSPNATGIPGMPGIHMAGTMSPMHTGMSAGTMPASASAMAGASSVRGGHMGLPGTGMGITPHPTGATAMSAHTTRSLAQMQANSIPGGFKASLAPHNTGAGSAFNFQNLPPPRNAFGEEIDQGPNASAEEGGADDADSEAAAFVGAPTRIGDVSPDNPARPLQPIGTGNPSGAPSSPPIKQETHPMSKTMKYAAELGSKELLAALPKGKTLSDATIAESRGAAMVDATRAFFGTHRPAFVYCSSTFVGYMLTQCANAFPSNITIVRDVLYGVSRKSTIPEYYP